MVITYVCTYIGHGGMFNNKYIMSELHTKLCMKVFLMR